MTWREKANEIAEIVLDKMEDNCTDGNYIREEVLKGLRNAAMLAFKFECDNWMRKSK